MAQTLSQIKGRQAPALQEGVAFVEMTGDDASATLGNPSLPFATAQAAYNAVYAAYLADTTKSYLIRFGIGTWAGVVTTHSTHPANISFVGVGASVSFLGGFTNNDPESLGASVAINGDGSIHLGDVTLTGVDGMTPADSETDPGQSGGDGGSGSLALVRCVAGTLTVTGGYGSDGGSAPTSAGNGGDGGDAMVSLTACTVQAVTTAAGGGGTQGTPFETSSSNFPGQGGNSTIDIQRTAYADLTTTYNVQPGYEPFEGSGVINDYGIDGTVGGTPSSNQKIGF